MYGDLMFEQTQKSSYLQNNIQTEQIENIMFLTHTLLKQVIPKRKKYLQYLEKVVM